jgi:outer membrane protein
MSAMHGWLVKYKVFVGITGVLLVACADLKAQAPVWTLDACIRQALKENVLLNEQETNNAINTINYTQAGAAAMPNLNFSDGQTFNYGRYENPASITYSNRGIGGNSAVLASTLTLYNGGKIKQAVRQADINLKTGNLDIEKAKNDLTLNVVAAYVQVLYSYEAIEIAQTVVAADTEHLNYTAKYVRAGSLPQSNLFLIQAQLATDRAAVVAAENQLMLAKLALLQLMEIPETADFDVQRPSDEVTVPDIGKDSHDIFETAKAFLPEIKSAALKAEAASLALGIARTEILPKLTLGGTFGTTYSGLDYLYGYHYTTLNQQIGYLQSNPADAVYGPVTNVVETAGNYSPLRQMGDNLNLGLSLNLLVPIFNNLQYKSDIKRAEVALQVAKWMEKDVSNQLRKAIEQAYTDRLAAAKNLVAAREQLAAETKSFHDMEIKFKAGTENATDFFVEKSNYNKSVASLSSAKYEYIYKTKIINFYLGNSINP